MQSFARSRGFVKGWAAGFLTHALIFALFKWSQYRYKYYTVCPYLIRPVTNNSRSTALSHAPNSSAPQ